MLHELRRRARIVAAALLVSLASLGASTVIPHSDDCHDACAIALFEHDATTHGLQAVAASDGHPLHCVACHLSRVSRPSLQVVHLFAPAEEGDGRALVVVVRVPLVLAAAQPPLRAPPASPAHAA
jgi:hypothetical protein